MENAGVNGGGIGLELACSYDIEGDAVRGEEDC